MYTGQCCLSLLPSRHLGTSHSSPNHYQPPRHFSLINDLKSFLSKVILVWGKARSCTVPNLCCRGLSHLGDVFPKNSAGDMMHELVCCDEAANHQLPIAVAFWNIWTVSMEECSSLTQNLMQIRCSTCLVILTVKATQYTSSLNGVYHRHCPVQLSLFTHVHSSPLSLAARLHICHTNHFHYIDNGWTFSGQTSYFCFTFNFY